MNEAPSFNTHSIQDKNYCSDKSVYKSLSGINPELLGKNVFWATFLPC